MILILNLRAKKVFHEILVKDIKKKKLNGFRVGYVHPWIIYSGKIRVWILTGINNRVSMGKLFGSGMGIPDPYPTHDHPYV